MDTLPTLDGSREAEPVGVELPAIYEDLGPLGAGGMATVRRVRHRALGMTLAMKILRRALADAPRDRDQFLHEARLTAQLAHPGVVAVQDLGELPDGRPWFTMEEVSGETLHAVLAREELPLARSMPLLLRVCETVAYAHDRGVVHRDLKPHNVMLGAFGEVRVTDWGLGCRWREDEGRAPGLGTRGWMAPEQAAGERVGPPADCWALGALLRVLLPTVDPPTSLLALTHAAAEPDPAARPDAATFARELRAWLEGARRRAEAAAWLARADALAPELAATRERAAEHARAAQALRQALLPHSPEAEKRPVWRLEDRAAEARVSAELLETAWLRHLQAALAQAPDLAAAHERLAGHHANRLLEAERAGDAAAAARHGALLRDHDRGSHAAVVRGLARIDLVTDPPGAKVLLHRLEPCDRRLQPVESTLLGFTPILGAVVPYGRYVAWVERAGHERVVVPLALERGGHWDGRAPGADAPHPVVLPPTIGPGWCYVPAGPFWCGGDPAAIDALPERRVWVDAFRIGAAPVTVAEYLAFLDALPPGEAEPLLPRDPASDAPLVRRVGGAWAAVDDPAGHPVAGDLPVTWIDHTCARAYARWWGERHGVEARLPTGLEWEKAARGVDRRVYPCGDHMDPTWTVWVSSRPDRPRRQPVDTCPLDVSPYGVRGLAGNVRDWCADAWRHEGGTVVGGRHRPDLAGPGELVEVRGGCYASGPVQGRLAGRLAAAPDARLPLLGFRLAAALD